MDSTSNKGYLSWIGSVSILVLLLFLAGTLNCNAGGSGMNGNDESQPKWEDYATIESITNGVPVYSFSNIMYVYGQSPDLYPGLRMQEGNTNPAVKFTPKKSWEIEHNYCGAEHEMTRRSPSNDSQPLLPIHLIDGDPNTVWSSWGCPVPDGWQEWIRVDLPMETEVASVALVCAPNFRWGDYGKALPKEVEIQVSKDAWHWETVYENKEVPADGITTLKAEFKPVRAKQIWIKGGNFHKQVGLNQFFVFSIGEVEVKDTAGNNLALVSRGAGVTVSSTSYGYLNDRYTQDALWNTLQYDLGNKWVRLGPDNGSLMWHYVEHEKGRLEIDPVADASVTECVKNGVNVIFVLDFKGNWLYANSPGKANWKEARFREFNDGYNDTPPSVNENPEMFKAYLRYVDLMVRHFKDRVTIFEIGNEWNRHFGDSYGYMTEIFEPTYHAIKKAAPDAKIMLGNPSGYDRDVILNCLGRDREYGIKDGGLAATSSFFYESTTIVREDARIKDGSISVDAINKGIVSMLLRYRDDKNYLKASYSAAGQSVFFAECVDGTETPGAKVESIPVFGKNLRMTVKLQGSEATLTVSDGKETASVTHTISSEKLQGEGVTGLTQFAGIVEATGEPYNDTSLQLFDNFQVSDAKGKVIVEDTFDGPEGTVPAGWKYITGGKNLVTKGWGAKIDAIGWHTGLNVNARYFDNVREFKKECEALGFKGDYFVTEIYAGAGYPPGPSAWYSEEGMAKYLVQSVVGHGGLDIPAQPCHPHFTSYPHPQALARTTWASQIVNPCQPSMSYYMWRNVSTAMADFYAAEFPVKIASEKEIISFTFTRGANESMVAAWLNGVMGDGITESKADITLPGMKAKKAWVVDIMNGTEQELKISAQSDGTVIKGMLIKDYPVFIRIAQI